MGLRRFKEVTYEYNHCSGKGINERTGPVPFVVGFLVESNEHRERDDEVEGIKGDSNLIHAVAVRKGVVREGLDCLGLGKRPEQGDDEYSQGEANKSHPIVGIGHLGSYPAEEQVGDGVIRLEVGLSEQETHRRNAVQLVLDGEGILGAQQGKEVVRPEVVSNEVKRGDPHIRLESVALVPRQFGFSWKWPDQRNSNAGHASDEADSIVP